MRETEKNYEHRVANGDFKKYLHGSGIDIGGGDDCLKLPPNVEGSVRCWDLMDGDAQYLHRIRDNTFDFVYSSHCLEHMRDLNIAMTNWLRVCNRGGVLYLCVPYETYYEKGVWPSKNNSDHKWSFTVDQGSDMPKNVVVKEFLERFRDWIDVIEVRENLMNYHFDWPAEIDQTRITEEKICAQIDIIARKKDMVLSDQWRRENAKNWFVDYWKILFPIQLKIRLKQWLPESVQKALKGIKKHLRNCKAR